MKRISNAILGMLCIGSINAQFASHVVLPDTSKTIIADTTDPSYIYASDITASELREHLSVLASDAYEGRETGTRGNELAAAYIAQQFQKLGLPAVGIENSYYQPVAFNRTGWEANSIRINDTEFKHLWDYLAFARMNNEVENFRPDEVIFLGYGIDDPAYSDYKGNDVKGKVIMINKGEPFDADSVSYITGSTEASSWNDDIWKKLETAEQHGVRMVLVIENELKSFLGKNRRFLVSPSLQLGDGSMDDKSYADHIYISSTMAKEIIGTKDKKVRRWRAKNQKKGKARDIKLCPDIFINMEKEVEVIDGYNVMGFVEGNSKKDELIVVSAHYDHLGKRGKDIFNGADDNASGTSTLLEMAESMARAKADGVGPERSILFLLVTGEEKGLLGSKYYAENPVYPLENTIANVNVDMVGRVDEKYMGTPEYIYVIGSDRLSSELHHMNEAINDRYSGIILDYKYNDENDPNRYYFRSDHYNFARKGIPAIFFFSGTHEDYHRPSDTIEKIQFDKMEKIARHIFHLTWALANRPERITVDGKVENE